MKWTQTSGDVTFLMILISVVVNEITLKVHFCANKIIPSYVPPKLGEYRNRKLEIGFSRFYLSSFSSCLYSGRLTCDSAFFNTVAGAWKFDIQIDWVGEGQCRAIRVYLKSSRLDGCANTCSIYGQVFIQGNVFTFHVGNENKSSMEHGLDHKNELLLQNG